MEGVAMEATNGRPFERVVIYADANETLYVRTEQEFMEASVDGEPRFSLTSPATLPPAQPAARQGFSWASTAAMIANPIPSQQLGKEGVGAPDGAGTIWRVGLAASDERSTFFAPAGAAAVPEAGAPLLHRMLEKATVRLEILRDRAEGCDALTDAQRREHRGHALTRLEVPGWIKEQREVLLTVAVPEAGALEALKAIRAKAAQMEANRKAAPENAAHWIAKRDGYAGAAHILGTALSSPSGDARPTWESWWLRMCNTYPAACAALDAPPDIVAPSVRKPGFNEAMLPEGWAEREAARSARPDRYVEGWLAGRERAAKALESPELDGDLPWPEAADLIRLLPAPVAAPRWTVGFGDLCMAYGCGLPVAGACLPCKFKGCAGHQAKHDEHDAQHPPPVAPSVLEEPKSPIVDPKAASQKEDGKACPVCGRERITGLASIADADRLCDTKDDILGYGSSRCWRLGYERQRAAVARLRDRMVAAFGQGTDETHLVEVAHEHEREIARADKAEAERDAALTQAQRFADSEAAAVASEIIANANALSEKQRADAAEAEVLRLTKERDEARAASEQSRFLAADKQEELNAALGEAKALREALANLLSVVRGSPGALATVDAVLAADRALAPPNPSAEKLTPAARKCPSTVDGKPCVNPREHDWEECYAVKPPGPRE